MSCAVRPCQGMSFRVQARRSLAISFLPMLGGSVGGSVGVGGSIAATVGLTGLTGVVGGFLGGAAGFTGAWIGMVAAIGWFVARVNSRTTTKIANAVGMAVIAMLRKSLITGVSSNF